MPLTISAPASERTQSLATALASLCDRRTIVYLEGELGAGKTTFSQGFIKALGYNGRVKSPTYTLVEPYDVAPWRIFHFDLYRLADPEELEYMGIRDYFADDCICLIEWPSRGVGMLAAADLTITLTFEGEGRIITFTPSSAYGNDLVKELEDAIKV